MQNTLTRYAGTLLPVAVLVLGVLDAAQKAGTNLIGWQTITQLLLLLATTAAAYWLPLVPGRWAGAAKTGAAIVGAAVSALIAVVPDGHFTQGAWILFLTALVKAVMVQLGVSIRMDASQLPPAKVLAVDVTPTSPVGSAPADTAGRHEATPEG